MRIWVYLTLYPHHEREEFVCLRDYLKPFPILLLLKYKVRHHFNLLHFDCLVPSWIGRVNVSCGYYTLIVWGQWGSFITNYFTQMTLSLDKCARVNVLHVAWRRQCPDTASSGLNIWLGWTHLGPSLASPQLSGLPLQTCEDNSVFLGSSPSCSMLFPPLSSHWPSAFLLSNLLMLWVTCLESCILPLFFLIVRKGP